MNIVLNILMILWGLCIVAYFLTYLFEYLEKRKFKKIFTDNDFTLDIDLINFKAEGWCKLKTKRPNEQIFLIQCDPESGENKLIVLRMTNNMNDTINLNIRDIRGHDKDKEERI